MTGKFVVTGCAGSGTRWASVVFTKLDLPCGHQQIYRVRGIRNRPRLVGDSSFFAAPLVHEVPVLLLIRNPLSVVRSLDQHPDWLRDGEQNPDHLLTAEYIRRHRPGVFDAADRLGRILRYVATWDDDIRGPAVHTLKIEDTNRGSPIARAVTALTGKTRKPANCRRRLREIGTTVNTHGGPGSTVTLEQITSHPDGQPVIDKARRWGYDL